MALYIYFQIIILYLGSIKIILGFWDTKSSFNGKGLSHKCIKRGGKTETNIKHSKFTICNNKQVEKQTNIMKTFIVLALIAGKL